LTLAVSILAGGQSTRMGRDKARLRLGGISLLAHVRRVAAATGWPVRVIRRDWIPGCGPLGGVHTSLGTTRTAAEVFLACDMPFVSVELIRRVASGLGARRLAVFASVEGVPGFPFVIRAGALGRIEAQLRSGRVSLRELARTLRARLVAIPRRWQDSLANLNTPDDWSDARTRLSGAGSAKKRADRRLS
jgi:molybdopterin-guanine dinucleotide biosynthesis protein A